MIRRYLSIYWALIRFSLSRAMEFRFDFYFRFLMDCMFYAISILFFEVIFLHTDYLGGWNRAQILFFLSGSLLIDAVYMTAVARNVWEMPRIINRGELDFFIIRPVSTLFMLMARNFEVASVINVLVALGIMGYSLTLFPEPLSLFNLLGCFLLLFNGLLLFTCLRLFTVLPVFWTHSELGFHMLFMSVSQVMERPEFIFRGAMHILFTTLLPFIVITSFPARYFFGELSGMELLYSLGLTGLFLGLTFFVWRMGLKAYTSASS